MTHAVTEKAVEFINEIRDAPFLMYLAYNAPHWPLQAPQKDIDKYKGRYDRGWDVIRKERFERMKRMGVLSEDAVLSQPDEKLAGGNGTFFRLRRKRNGQAVWRYTLP